MWEVFDQNAPRTGKKVPVVATTPNEAACLEYIQKANPGKVVTTSDPPFGPGKFVYLNGDYSYFIVPK